MRNALYSVLQDFRPCIKTVDAIEQSAVADSLLENLMQDFIDTLKARGII